MQFSRFYLKKFPFVISHLCMLLVLYAPATRAGESADDNSLWRVSLGGGVQVTPQFEGSNKYDADFLPLIDVEFMDRFFLSTVKGLGVYAVNSADWQLGAAVNYDPGRKEKVTRYDSGKRKKKQIELLRGMGDIDGGAVFNIFGAWTPGPFSFGLETKYGTGDLQGLTVTGSAGYTLSLLSDLQWENAISTTFADSKYANTFFGVNERQSRESYRGYKYYSADSGIKDVALSSTLTYSYNDNVSFILYGEYKRLIGPAASSPLVKTGSENQAIGVFGVIYTF